MPCKTSPDQMSLLDWHPSPELTVEPEPAAPPPNQNAIDWYTWQAAYYLQLIGRFQRGGLAIESKRHMIAHAHTLRQTALEKLEAAKR